MKKIHYLTIAAIAGALALTGCRRGGKPSTSSTSGSSSTSSTTSSTTSSDPVVQDKVVSVTVSPEKATIQPGKTASLKATVTVEGSASKDVTWKSSDTSIATVSSSGVVTAKAPGTVVVTVTSTFDTSKSACAVITVEDTGFNPDYIGYGFEYLNEFPLEDVYDFIGESAGSEDYEFISPLADIGYGCYAYRYPGDETYISQYIFRIKAEQFAQSYYLSLLAHGWTQVVTSEYDGVVIGGVFVDPTKTFTIEVEDAYDYDEEGYVYFTGESDMYVFKSDEYWSDSTPTTDTEWNEAKLQEAAEYNLEASMLEVAQHVPFVALGSEYSFEPVTELALFWEVPVSNTLIISDNCLDESLLDGYGDLLESQGYMYDEDNNEYLALIDSCTYISISYGWTSTGNTITAQILPYPNATFPDSAVASFVYNSIESFYSVPEYVISESPYTEYEYFGFEDILCYSYEEDEETEEYVITGQYRQGKLTVYNAYLDDVSAYFETLEAAGYTVVVDETYLEYGYIDFAAQKGYIYLEGSFEMDYDPETYEYYDYGQFYFTITRDENGEETPIEFEVQFIDLLQGSTKTTEAVVYASGDVTYSSDNLDVATVNPTSGEVEAIAKGSATITATLDTGTAQFTASYVLNVKEAATGVSISGDASVQTGKTATYVAVPTPEGTTFADTPVWSITSGSEYASINEETGVLTAGAVTSDVQVTVKVNVGGFEDTKVVTIKSQAAEVTDTITLEKLGVEPKTSYVDFNDKSDQSSAKYSGQCAGDGGSIQIRSKNSNSGIYSSTSGGTIVSITLNFHEKDTRAKGIKIVASNEPFTNTGSLYSATVVTTLTPASSDESITYEFTEEYAYVGIISAEGAHFFQSIEFVWAD